MKKYAYFQEQIDGRSLRQLNSLKVLTAGKLYEVINESNMSFNIVDDLGVKILCLHEGCAYINGSDWKFIEG